MKFLKLFLTFLTTGLLNSTSYSQDTSVVFNWQVNSKKLSAGKYELNFSTEARNGWNLYAPDQDLAGVNTTTLNLSDSAIKQNAKFNVDGSLTKQSSKIFEGITESVFRSSTTWSKVIIIEGEVPSAIQGSLLYTYVKEENFLQGEYNFSVALEGGVRDSSRIKIATIDVERPVSGCGDDQPKDKSLWNLFFLGLGAGLLALLFPCIFPLIPLTVSFFTKKAQSRSQGLRNAIFYGGSIFLIYTLISLPFHLFNLSPEILNNISTNVPLNIIFFLIFVVFAISFFGYFEITLPSGLATKVDSKAGLGDMLGIFFMALTLVIVSFSCTSGILGALLFGSLQGSNGAWQLTAGLAGFGFGLGLPFVLFALFPHWLRSLPKSGGWMNELKAVFGFIELAMAVKFLSNADLVKQWHLLEREVFIGLWIVIDLAIVLYLCGVFRFSGDSKPKFTPVRLLFIALFAGLTIYLVPGVTNTKAANLRLISGFPPPFYYSVYSPSVNYAQGVKPIKNDYEKALQLARAQNKPILIDFTGWACVNCRKMEEKVWVDEEVEQMMMNDFIVVSLYVDERSSLPRSQQTEYTTADGSKKFLTTVGDKWATFQAENFHAVAQPQYAIISPGEIALTKTKDYTESAKVFSDWLKCGLSAHRQTGNKK